MLAHLWQPPSSTPTTPTPGLLVPPQQKQSQQQYVLQEKTPFFIQEISSPLNSYFYTQERGMSVTSDLLLELFPMLQDLELELTSVEWYEVSPPGGEEQGNPGRCFVIYRKVQRSLQLTTEPLGHFCKGFFDINQIPFYIFHLEAAMNKVWQIYLFFPSLHRKIKGIFILW